MESDRVAGWTEAALSGLDVNAYSAMEYIGRAVHLRDADLDKTLEAVLASATELISGTAAAGLNLMIKGRFVPQATVGTEPPPLDEVQRRTGAGPCIDASLSQAPVRVDNMHEEDRWPTYVSAATALGVHAMVCVPLWIDDTRLGSLSLYATEEHCYSEKQTQVASLFATQAAIAIADAQLASNLRIALKNRDVIGQAKGILMERMRLTADQAFDVLNTISQLTNRRVSEIAEQLATTGALPESPRPIRIPGQSATADADRLG